MNKTINRKNNCTVHFMVSEDEMKELNRRFALTNFKNKREFYLDSIMKNRIVSIDLSGTFRKELRELSALVSKNSSNINQIAKVINSTGIVYREDIESIKNVLENELMYLTDFRSKVTDYMINKVVL